MRLASLILSLVAVSCAAPSNFFDDAYDFSDDLSEYYGRVSHYIHKLGHSSSPLECDVSKIKLPSWASKLNITSLSNPEGLKPLSVALGRGTQNYTCADSTSSSTPAATGAVANLYNATCIAANWPVIMESLPSIAYKISLPTNEYAVFPPANIELMGHHFFYDPTTPEFNLDTTKYKQYGIAMTKKANSADAPESAAQGKYGAVSWLSLKTTTGTVGKYKAVYRVNTASGSPPDTCEGMPSSFEIQYSANYYFYGN